MNFPKIVPDPKRGRIVLREVASLGKEGSGGKKFTCFALVFALLLLWGGFGGAWFFLMFWLGGWEYAKHYVACELET